MGGDGVVGRVGWGMGMGDERGSFAIVSREFSGCFKRCGRVSDKDRVYDCEW